MPSTTTSHQKSPPSFSFFSSSSTLSFPLSLRQRRRPKLVVERGERIFLAWQASSKSRGEKRKRKRRRRVGSSMREKEKKGKWGKKRSCLKRFFSLTSGFLSEARCLSSPVCLVCVQYVLKENLCGKTMHTRLRFTHIVYFQFEFKAGKRLRGRTHSFNETRIFRISITYLLPPSLQAPTQPPPLFSLIKCAGKGKGEKEKKRSRLGKLGL